MAKVSPEFHYTVTGKDGDMKPVKGELHGPLHDSSIDYDTTDKKWKLQTSTEFDKTEIEKNKYQFYRDPLSDLAIGMSFQEILRRSSEAKAVRGQIERRIARYGERLSVQDRKVLKKQMEKLQSVPDVRIVEECPVYMLTGSKGDELSFLGKKVTEGGKDSFVPALIPTEASDQLTVEPMLISAKDVPECNAHRGLPTTFKKTPNGYAQCVFDSCNKALSRFNEAKATVAREKVDHAQKIMHQLAQISRKDLSAEGKSIIAVDSENLTNLVEGMTISEKSKRTPAQRQLRGNLYNMVRALMIANYRSKNTASTLRNVTDYEVEKLSIGDLKIKQDHVNKYVLRIHNVKRKGLGGKDEDDPTAVQFIVEKGTPNDTDAPADHTPSKELADFVKHEIRVLDEDVGRNAFVIYHINRFLTCASVYISETQTSNGNYTCKTTSAMCEYVPPGGNAPAFCFDKAFHDRITSAEAGAHVANRSAFEEMRRDAAAASRLAGESARVDAAQKRQRFAGGKVKSDAEKAIHELDAMLKKIEGGDFDFSLDDDEEDPEGLAGGYYMEEAAVSGGGGGGGAGYDYSVSHHM